MGPAPRPTRRSRPRRTTVRTTAMFILLIVSGLFSAFVLTRLGIPQATARLLVGLDVPPWAIICRAAARHP